MKQPNARAFVFGALVKSFRADARLGLREFCRRSGYDASNWSRVERGLFRPPSKRAELIRLANLLGLTVGSDDWLRLVSAAYEALLDVTKESYERDLESIEREFLVLFPGGKYPAHKPQGEVME